MPGQAPGSFVTTPGQSADHQMAFPAPGQFVGSSPTSSCDMVAFTGHGSAFPQWQFGCTMPTPFPCSPVVAHAGGPEVQAAYPCQGVVQPFAVMPVPVAPPYGVACAPAAQHTPGYDGWGVDVSAGHMPPPS